MTIHCLCSAKADNGYLVLWKVMVKIWTVRTVLKVLKNLAGVTFTGHTEGANWGM